MAFLLSVVGVPGKVMHTIGNFIIELSRMQHLTDRNIADHLAVDLPHLRALADFLKTKGVIIDDEVTHTDTGDHVTWHLKHGKDADANLDYARSRDVQLDGPIVPKAPPWWTQDFVRTGVLRQGP